MRKRRTPSVRDQIADRGPWYGLATAEDIRRSVGGFGTAGDDLTSLSLAHEFGDGFVSVETDADDEESAEEAEWDALRDVLENYVDFGPVNVSNPDEISQRAGPTFPLSLHITRDEIDLRVDSVPTRFVRVGDPTRWVAWTRIRDRTVKVRAWDISPDRVALAYVEPALTYEIDDFSTPVLWERFERE